MSRHKTLSIMAAALLAMPLSGAGVSLEDYDDPDNPRRQRRGGKRLLYHQTLSPESMAENARISAENKKKKTEDDILLSGLKDAYPSLTGKALRKKLKELKRRVRESK